MRAPSRAVAGLVPIFCVTSFGALAQGRPAIIHEAIRVPLPEQYHGASGVCLAGDELLVLADRFHEGEFDRQGVWAIARFARQTSGDWLFVEELAATIYDDDTDIWMYESLACDGDVAAVSTPVAESFILERTSAGWEVTPLGHSGSDAAVYDGTVAIGGQWGSPTSVAVYRKDASGAWTDVGYAVGNPGARMDPEVVGPYYVRVADGEIVATGDSYMPAGSWDTLVSDTQVFDLVNGGWQLTATLPERYTDPTVIGNRIALPMQSWTEPGEVASLFTRDASGAWTIKHTLLSEELASAWDFVVTDDRIYALSEKWIRLFSEETDRRYRHEATFLPSDLAGSQRYGDSLGFFSVDGDWIAGAGGGLRNVYLFQVPATLPTPQRSEETFEDNAANGWSVWGLSDWRIVSSSGSRAYRQLNTSGDARAILETSDGTDQSIQADVKIQSLAGATPWAGLMVRYTNPQNFYYLLVDRDSVEIRRIANGAFGPIATAPFSLVLGRTYRFRLEAIGERIRAFVNGEMVAEVIDDTHAQGKAGLTMWRAAAEYDNVVVTTNPQTDLFTDSFDSNHLEALWSSTPTGVWTNEFSGVDNNRVYRQPLLTGSPRAVTGAHTHDQIITATVRPRAFNSNGKGSVGLLARYVDHLNFYYIILTDTDRVILGKRANGAYMTLDQAAMVVAPNGTYIVRAEAIGSSLRVYVNDRLMAEAQDATFPMGRYGLVTFDAAADYDELKAVRP